MKKSTTDHAMSVPLALWMHRLYFSTRKIRCLHFCLLLQSQFEGVQLLEAVVKVAKPLCDRGEQAGEEHKFSERGQVSTVVCRRRLFRVSTQSMKNQNSMCSDWSADLQFFPPFFQPALWRPFRQFNEGFGDQGDTGKLHFYSQRSLGAGVPCFWLNVENIEQTQSSLLLLSQQLISK